MWFGFFLSSASAHAMTLLPTEEVGTGEKFLLPREKSSYCVSAKTYRESISVHSPVHSERPELQMDFGLPALLPQDNRFVLF